MRRTTLALLLLAALGLAAFVALRSTGNSPGIDVASERAPGDDEARPLRAPAGEPRLASGASRRERDDVRRPADAASPGTASGTPPDLSDGPLSEPAEAGWRRTVVAREIARIEANGTEWERVWARKALEKGDPLLARAVRHDQSTAWKDVHVGAAAPTRRNVRWRMWLAPVQLLHRVGFAPRAWVAESMARNGWSYCADTQVEEVERAYDQAMHGVRPLDEGERVVSEGEELEIGPLEGVRAVVRLSLVSDKFATVGLTLRRTTTTGLQFTPWTPAGMPTGRSLLVTTVQPLVEAEPDRTPSAEQDDTVAFILLTVDHPSTPADPPHVPRPQSDRHRR